jgi:hypothetical protein
MLRLLVALFLAMSVVPAQAAVSQTGTQGQILSVSEDQVSGKKIITVSGKGFDETVGIYLAYCKIPAPGTAPTPCGGGKNLKGIGQASHWISSNPPPYGAQLAIPFQPGGRFTQKVSVSENIGKINCRKVRCGITVRADHLREGDRSHDLFIPIKFSTKKK